MTIDILSDLHIDIYFKPNRPLNTDAVRSLYDSIILNNNTRTPADVLIIAGDIGHYNSQNIELLKILKKEYYKYIVCVLGNHDYYLIDKNMQDKFNNSSFNRIKDMKNLIPKEKNIYCLDGDIVKINDIKFGGCDSSYNEAYIKHYFSSKDKNYINKLWQQTSNDYNYIKGIKNFDDIYNIELPKLQAVYNKCDIMITHVNPSYKENHIPKQYHNEDTNTFFTFD